MSKSHSKGLRDAVIVYAQCIKNYGIVQVSILSLKELGSFIRWLVNIEVSVLESSITPTLAQ